MKEQDTIENNLPLNSYADAWRYIQTLEYTNKSGILFLEQQLYNLLQQLPEDANLLALLLHEQIMNNRGQRARSIAYKIWESGGILAPEIERMYVDDLINLGLEDMAGAALAPYIADLENSIEKYSGILVKYAMFTGNTSLLERVLSYLPDTEYNQGLHNWIEMNNEEKVMGHIQPIMKRLEENVLEAMMGFRYKVFMTRGFPDIEFLFYVDETITNYTELRETMHLQISAYCAAHKIQDMKNLNVVILPVERRLPQSQWMQEL